MREDLSNKDPSSLIGTHTHTFSPILIAAAAAAVVVVVVVVVF